MNFRMEQDENGNWYIKVPLIGETKRRLEKLAAVIAVSGPDVLAASLLHDILEDDEESHISPEDVAAEQGFRKLH